MWFIWRDDYSKMTQLSDTSLWEKRVPKDADCLRIVTLTVKWSRQLWTFITIQRPTKLQEPVISKVKLIAKSIMPFARRAGRPQSTLSHKRQLEAATLIAQLCESSGISDFNQSISLIEFNTARYNGFLFRLRTVSHYCYGSSQAIRTASTLSCRYNNG